MAYPLYPSLIPRYVDESWFSSDQPIDEAAKLNEMEANHEAWIQEAQYRTTDVLDRPHIEPIEDDANDDDEDEEDVNEDDDEDDDDMDDGDDMDYELGPNDSPIAM